MKIATYNVWNENKGTGNRFAQLKNEILRIDADIIGMQEVTPALFQLLIKQLSYAHHLYFRYPWEEEGLALFSKYPISEGTALFNDPFHKSSRAIHAIINIDGHSYSLTNLHLPWDSALQREKQILHIDQYVHSVNADFYILLGDFNSGLNSSVNRYLVGDCTLDRQESVPCWNELSSAYAARNAQEVSATLDPIRNPRWAGKLAPFSPMVMDRIYVMESWNSIQLHVVSLFGQEISPENHLAPSDHYGVMAELSFSK